MTDERVEWPEGVLIVSPGRVAVKFRDAGGEVRANVVKLAPSAPDDIDGAVAWLDAWSTIYHGVEVRDFPRQEAQP